MVKKDIVEVIKAIDRVNRLFRKCQQLDELMLASGREAVAESAARKLVPTGDSSGAVAEELENHVDVWIAALRLETGDSLSLMEKMRAERRTFSL
jgi:hypothetical protein